MKIDELLIEFDEMGFAPTTLCKNSEEYACEWKKQLVAEIKKLKIQLEQANAGIVNCSGCKLVEINAVRAFAEKLKEICVSKRKFIDIDDEEEYYFDGAVTITEIDELLKEYENERN